MKNLAFLALASICTYAHAAPPEFSKTVAVVNKSVKCNQAKTTPASDGFGALYGCVSGAASTAKIFINEEAGTGKVKNIKIMWNDWFLEGGYGVHPDHIEAHSFVDAVTKMFVPSISKKLQANFIGQDQAEYDADGYKAIYSYHRGPKIEERLITLTPK